MRLLFASAAIVFALAAPSPALAQPKGKEPPPVVSTKDVPINGWARIAWSPTGGREQPVFVYAPNIDRFVMASGIQATGGVALRHYDTEEFDLKSAQWLNAYPPAVAAGRPIAGPVGEEYAKDRMLIGYNRPELFYKDGDNLRLGAGGQWLETRMGYEWCFVPENGKIYVDYRDKLLTYDPAKRGWEDLGVKPRTNNRLWGSLCYDPINKEIVHAGGDGASDEIGTWVYSIDKNEWRKLELGSAKLKELQAVGEKLHWQAKRLVGAAANRFAVSETTEEAKADLRKLAAQLAEAVQGLAAQIKTADLKGSEKASAEVAVQRLSAVAKALGTVGDKLAEKITPSTIQDVRAARTLIGQTLDALAAEPRGRARSQIVYDPVHKKIVMFGGDALDKVVADTWFYDCATRTWEQKFPKTCPSPRAGHVLAWLPKAKQIVLAGGYSRDWLPQEIWTYDVAVNEWRPLLHLPLQSEEFGRVKASQNCPRVTARGTQLGAVADDDTLVCITSSQGALTTWACKIDPARPTASAAEAVVGNSGQYTWNRIDPAEWEKVAEPDAARMKTFYADLPANQWTAIKFAKYAPGATNRWGTSAYDTKRHQILLWGGGHATSQENDVAHFSLRGGCWTLGFHPDDPIETVYASQPTPVSFADRPHVPIHAYRAYTYDSTADKMFYLDRGYDLAAREWEPKPYPGLQHRGTMHSHMTDTPQGAITFSERGLYQFYVEGSKWLKETWEGPKPSGIWCDGDGLRYDSKRHCVWFSVGPELYRYPLATGKAEKIAVKAPKALGKYVFHAESAYIADADLILFMKRFQKPDGTWANIAFDPATSKFVWIDMPYVGPDGKEIAPKQMGEALSWHDALAYDPELKLVVLNSSHLRQVFVLRFDRKTAKMDEVRE